MKKFDIGEWQIRDGRKAVVTEIIDWDKDYPLFGYIIGSDGTPDGKATWTKAGTYIKGGKEHDGDLIGPWEEESHRTYTAFRQMFPPGTKVKAIEIMTGEELTGVVLHPSDVVGENTIMTPLWALCGSAVNNNLYARWNVKWEKDYCYGLGYADYEFVPLKKSTKKSTKKKTNVKRAEPVHIRGWIVVARDNGNRLSEIFKDSRRAEAWRNLYAPKAAVVFISGTEGEELYQK